MFRSHGSTRDRLFGSIALLVITGMVAGACGAPAQPGPSTPTSSTPTGTSTGSPTADPGGTLGVGPVTSGLPGFEISTEPDSWLRTSEDGERTRLRDQAGFAREFGPGWDALSTAVDEATDAAAQALAAEFSIDISSRGHDLIASLVAPNRPVTARPASAAAALALLGAALTASQGLGLGGTIQPTVSQSSTTTQGDSTATVTVNGQGVSISSGSRVFADFTFELSGSVTNSNTGATATMTGSATAHIEIDGCPDASGHSKGKVNLSSRETASNGIGWTRDLHGDFDITVDDDANIAGIAVDAQAQESVAPSTQEGHESDGHELGIRTHVEYTGGFRGMTHAGDALTLEVTHEENATQADLIPLFTSALTSVVAGAHILGQAAEKFWRDGKCIELIVSPSGGDVDANSTTQITVKVKHKIDGNELNKPVTATLGGVKTIDPEGQKQPAPATFTYTAGAQDRDKGDIAFESVSNRGIAKKSVTFTVAAVDWTTNATSPLGEITGEKCDGVGGDWRIEGVENLGLLTITTTVVVSINAATLAGTFNFHKLQVGGGTTTTHDSTGAARIVLNEDGSVTMTLDKAKITLHTENEFGPGSGTVVIDGMELIYPWTPATGEACS